MEKKERLFGIDFIRIACALLIYMRHSVNMFGCSYGSDSINAFITGTTSPVMALFFIVSGFSIYYNNKEKNWNINAIVFFYKKRAIQLFPTFLLIHFIWLIMGVDTVRRWIVLTPMSISGLQAMFPNIFGILHNGGTWFISCILIAYLIFPIVCGICDLLDHKKKILLTLLFLFACMYFPIVGMHYDLGGLYANPVFRCLEFSLGVCAASVVCDDKKAGEDKGKNAILMILTVIYTAAIFYVIYRNITIGFIGIPAIVVLQYPYFLLLLYSSYEIRNKVLSKNRVILYSSGLTYYFFIFQLILWTVSSAIISFAGNVGLDLSSNISKIVVSFITCVLISIVVNEFYDTPIKKRLKSRFL